MKVEITDYAKSELRKIHNYHVQVASPEIATKLINKILDAIDELAQLPSIGSKEPLLHELNKNYRYIVCANYKIIFYNTENVTYITDIFDCRQNPVKITKRNRQ